MFYLIYGLRLSTNLPIPGLVAIPISSEVDVEVLLGEMPSWLESTQGEPRSWYISSTLDEHGEPVLKVWLLADGAYFKLVYSDGTQFLVDRSGTKIWATWPETLTLEDTAIYLEGPVLGFVMRLRGMTCLHASSVAVGDQAVAIVGPAGAGKSTTVATFAGLGFPVLAEDVVTLSDRGDDFLIQPGYLRVRLWPESFKNLYGSSDQLPTLTPSWDKRYLDLTENGYRFQTEPLPLAAVYILNDRVSSPAAPFIESVSARDGMIKLVQNTYTNYMLDMTQRAREFELLSRLIARVPLRQVTPHTDPSRLSELCEFILDDFRSLTVPAHS